MFNNAGGGLLITMLMHASFDTFASKIVAPLFPAPLLNDYGLLPEPVGFGAVAVIVVAATRGRLSLATRPSSRGARRLRAEGRGASVALVTPPPVTLGLELFIR